MKKTVKISEPNLVYCAPNNELTLKWGVYAIPKMWREPSGDLIIRVNGEQDDGFTRQLVPNLYFCSKDNGDTWENVVDGEQKYDLTALMGIDSPYYKCKNGDVIGFSYKKEALPISGVPFIKEYVTPNNGSVIRVYKYSDIPDECKGIKFIRVTNGEKIVKDIDFDFPEREVAVNAKGNDDGEFLPVPEYVQSNIFWSPYMSCLKEDRDGNLIATSHGQHPEVFDRQCEELYLVESKDSGKTWSKKSLIASDKEKYPFGYAGDGAEHSITQTSNGDLLCVMRMELSTREEYFCDALLTRSKDGGKTWSEPVSVADSSVTPHVVALNDGVVILIYGRPGVHFKVSEDNGETWSDAYTIIGKTLSEELNLGKSCFECKYMDMDSYSNTFVEKISDDTILVLYNDMKYKGDDGQEHKATLVRKITVK